MAYEHQVEVQTVGDNLYSIVKLMQDQVDDKQQALQFIADGTAAMAAAKAALDAEAKPEYDAKFGVKVGIYITVKFIKAMAASVGKSILLESLASLGRIMDIVLPDSAS